MSDEWSLISECPGYVDVIKVAHRKFGESEVTYSYTCTMRDLHGEIIGYGEAMDGPGAVRAAHADWKKTKKVK